MIQLRPFGMFWYRKSLYEYFRFVNCTFGKVARVCEAVEPIRMDMTSDRTDTILIALGTADIPILLVKVRYF